MVADDQEAVEHRSMPFAAVVAVKLYEPKFSPVIVTDEPPDVAPFKPASALTVGPAEQSQSLMCFACIDSFEIEQRHTTRRMYLEPTQRHALPVCTTPCTPSVHNGQRSSVRTSSTTHPSVRVVLRTAALRIGWRSDDDEAGAAAERRREGGRGAPSNVKALEAVLVRTLTQISPLSGTWAEPILFRPNAH